MTRRSEQNNDFEMWREGAREGGREGGVRTYIPAHLHVTQEERDIEIYVERIWIIFCVSIY